MILDEIVAHKRAELAERKERETLAAVEARARGQVPPRDFAVAIRQPDLTLIAEVKKASPSKGLLAPNLDPVALATAYQAGGAAAISVLTDRRFFQGELAHLTTVRTQVDRPVLRKDFLVEPYQVFEARAAGADAVLLIVSILTDEELRDLHSLAHSLGMAALVEVHDEAEARRALAAGAEIIGINNRDLRTFRVDLETTARIRPLIPPDSTLVSESGIHTRGDVARLREWGVHAMLVGESLVRSGDPAGKIWELLATDLTPWPTVPELVRCGEGGRVRGDGATGMS
ncbi:MAG: indole-3-glycerol phosphate synthase TrpC [Chloroflexi bacterium]|nr:indole-3-glycerol phosphate synthase TrpC [Chloroflexota bacterium]